MVLITIGDLSFVSLTRGTGRREEACLLLVQEINKGLLFLNHHSGLKELWHVADPHRAGFPLRTADP